MQAGTHEEAGLRPVGACGGAAVCGSTRWWGRKPAPAPTRGFGAARGLTGPQAGARGSVVWGLADTGKGPAPCSMQHPAVDAPSSPASSDPRPQAPPPEPGKRGRGGMWLQKG